MMRVDLDAARTKWIAEGPTPEERTVRSRSDFLRYQNGEGRFADFHSNRHMFITSLERAGLSPKMAQTLARHSDVRLTLGVYTQVGQSDQTAAIAALPAPPGFTAKNGAGEVPTMVPRGAEIGARRLALKPSDSAPDCTETAPSDRPSRGTAIAVTGQRHGELRRRTRGATGDLRHVSLRRSESTPGGIRTHDLRFRKPTLYPAELQGRTEETRYRTDPLLS